MKIHQWFNKESIGKSAAILTLFKVSERIIQVGRGIIFARLLGPAEYGVYTLAFFFIPLVVALAKLGIPSSFIRYVPQYEMKNALKDFIKKTCLIITASGIGIGLVCVVFVKKLSFLIYGSPMHSGIIMICALTILPYTLYESLAAIFAGLRVFRLQAILRFGQFLIFTILGIILIFYYPKAKPLILANFISLVIVTGLFGLLLKKYFSDHKSQNIIIKEPDFYRKISKFSLFYILTPVIYTMFSYTDRWILARLTDITQVGIYSVAVNVSGLIFMFGMIAGNVLTPNLSKIWETGNKTRAIYYLEFSTKVNIILLLIGAVILSLLKEQIIPLLYGEKYIEVLPIINMLIIFWLIQSINWTIAAYANLIEKIHILLFCNSVGLASNVFLNFILIPKVGLIGAALASTCSSTIILVMMFVWFYKNGFKVKLSTVLLCFSPWIFLLGGLFASLLLIIFISIILKTNVILSNEERNMLYTQTKQAILKKFNIKA